MKFRSCLVYLGILAICLNFAGQASATNIVAALCPEICSVYVILEDKAECMSECLSCANICIDIIHNLADCITCSALVLEDV